MVRVVAVALGSPSKRQESPEGARRSTHRLAQSVRHLADAYRQASNRRVRMVVLQKQPAVLSTSRHAEGTAIGFNNKKKEARSYYPLFCTVAQTAQILDVLPRSGNVHNSNGARPFIRQCIEEVRKQLPSAKLEARVDSAFFDEKTLITLALENVEFKASVPFERFPKLKTLIETRQCWAWNPTLVRHFALNFL